MRDVVSVGYAYFLTEGLRIYGEAGYGFNTEISEPWEFQFGLRSHRRGPRPRRAPFLAAHGHSAKNWTAAAILPLQAGWAWHGDRSTHLLRTGLHYYNGLSDQFQFYRQFEQQIGAGLWYDY